MKRFLLFTMHIYYPRGGWDDFVDSFDSIEEAKEYLLKHKDYDEWQIVDTKMEIKISEGRIE